MSLLSSFIAKHLVSSLESAFIAHAPDLQEAFLNEVKLFLGEVDSWLTSKVSGSSSAPVAPTSIANE